MCWFHSGGLPSFFPGTKRGAGFDWERPSCLRGGRLEDGVRWPGGVTLLAEAGLAAASERAFLVAASLLGPPACGVRSGPLSPAFRLKIFWSPLPCHSFCTWGFMVPLKGV